MNSLSEIVEVVIGVDTHVDTHTAAVVDARTGAVLDGLTVPTTPRGYQDLVDLADTHSPLRVWAVEGTGGHGAGLARHLAQGEELVVELDRPERAQRRHGAKSDPLDAVRAAREALARTTLGTPRAGGDRQALSVLLAARRSAVEAATVAQRQLFSLVIAAPEQLRSKLRCPYPCQQRPGHHPLPAQPLRRPPAQPGPARRRALPTALSRPDQGVHRPAHRPRQNTTRDPPLPQALHRPRPLSTPRKRPITGLTNHRSVRVEDVEGVSHPVERGRQLQAEGVACSRACGDGEACVDRHVVTRPSGVLEDDHRVEHPRQCRRSDRCRRAQLPGKSSDGNDADDDETAKTPNANRKTPSPDRHSAFPLLTPLPAPHAQVVPPR